MSDAVFPDLVYAIEDEIGLELPASILSGMEVMEDNFARPYSAGNRNSPKQIKNASKFS